MPLIIAQFPYSIAPALSYHGNAAYLLVSPAFKRIKCQLFPRTAIWEMSRAATCGSEFHSSTNPAHVIQATDECRMHPLPLNQILHQIIAGDNHAVLLSARLS
jgi:hypothetical protein